MPGRSRSVRSYQNLVLRCLLLAACALAASLPSAVAPPKTETEPHSVDGVSLGMTESDVRSRWGNLDRFVYPDDGTVILSKPGSSSIHGNRASLGPSGKVIEVTGRRLRLGGKLLLGTEHEFEDGFKLGHRVEKQASFCGNTGPLKMGRCAKGKFQFGFLGYRISRLNLKPGQELSTIIAQNPELTKVQYVRLGLNESE